MYQVQLANFFTLYVGLLRGISGKNPQTWKYDLFIQQSDISINRNGSNIVLPIEKIWHYKNDPNL